MNRPRIVRYGLAAVALGIAAAVFWLTDPGFDDDGLTVSGIDLTNMSDGLRLSNPRFTGETAKGEPFVLSAAWALPDGPRPEEVELNTIKGEVHRADGRTVTINANEGILYPKANIVTVAGDVRVERTDGYLIEVASATLNTESGDLRADGPVLATGPVGEITSGSLRAARDGTSGAGDYIWFENGVRVRIMQPNMARTP